MNSWLAFTGSPVRAASERAIDTVCVRQKKVMARAAGASSRQVVKLTPGAERGGSALAETVTSATFPRKKWLHSWAARVPASMATSM